MNPEPIENVQNWHLSILYSNSPWLKDPKRLQEPEKFRREAFFRVQKQMKAKHGMAVLIKGPRRVGKTEIQKQLIWDLIRVKKVDSRRVLYLTFDDILIQSEKPERRAHLIQNLLNTWAKTLSEETYDEIRGEAFCFFDEVQAVENWAHLIKNRVERNPNVKIVLSGSAAHSIFERSLKILLGRVVAEKLSTFSFREYLQKVNVEERNKPDRPFFERLQEIQQSFESDLSAPKLSENLQALFREWPLRDYNGPACKHWLEGYLEVGGFPQLWKIDKENDLNEFASIEKAQFIDENYVKKVTLEDLMLLQQIKKPELYERLLRHLFARPGQEYNQNKVASDLGTTAVTLAEAMKLLEQTDLLIFVEKFSQKAVPLKRKNLKIYPVDLSLTYATTKKKPSLESQENKGFVAESLVAQTLFRLKSLSNIAYMQSQAFGRSGEIDFYLRSDLQDCPIEVKYQNNLNQDDYRFIRNIVLEQKLQGALFVNQDRWGVEQGVYSIPLWAFALIA